MITGLDIQARAQELRARFEAAGAQVVDAPVLQSAGTLLDLYGEDIRARAYVTSDAARGEQMLRPDFTVPVVQMHMAEGAEPARYTYAGAVFRRQEDDPERANEYQQVGFELFAREEPAQADAEVFALFAQILAPLPVQAVTGDIGVLTAAVQGLKTTQRRKDALLRHIWRPQRFRALLDRFAGRLPVPPARQALLAGAVSSEAPLIGLRSEKEISARIAALREDAETAPISGEEVALIEGLLEVRAAMPVALSQMADLARDLPAIGPAVARVRDRCQALVARGVEVDHLPFEASYGRTSMEYYDGFVFGFRAVGQADWPAVATGGRYDALTRRLGGGREIPAVGGVMRPDLMLRLEASQ